MPITVDATWLVGILLAIIRVAAFAVASPILAKVMPKVGRGAFAIAVALALARPIAHVPDLPGLIAAAAVFLVSLTFRTIDLMVCACLPSGTHWAWHGLNAVVLFLALTSAVRYGRAQL